jgi:hypothetical protein
MNVGSNAASRGMAVLDRIRLTGPPANFSYVKNAPRMGLPLSVPEIYLLFGALILLFICQLFKRGETAAA